MKKLLLLVCVFGMVYLHGQEQITYDYESETSTLNFQYFGSTLDGSPVPLAENPDSAGANNSANVLAYTRAAGSEVWAGAFSTSTLNAPIGAVAGGTICVDVFFDHMGSLALKLEGSPTDTDNWITKIENTKVNEWETLCFSLDSASIEDNMAPAAGNVYNTIVIFPDFLEEAGVADEVTYLDNFVYDGVEAAAEYDITFKVDASEIEVGENGMFLAGNLINNWDATATPMSDDDEDGIWEVTVSLPAGDVEYKFINSGAWEELTPGGSCTITTGDFTNRLFTVSDSDEVLPAHLFGSCNVIGEGPMTIVYDFETEETALGFQYFGSSLDGTIVPVGDNPDTAGSNTSAKALMYTRAAGSEVWAGAFSNTALVAPINALEGDSICVDVFFDHMGSLALKLEGSPTDTDNWITQIENTKVNEWETLCFPLDAPSIEDNMAPAAGNVYNTIVIFPDFLADAGAADVVTFIDNIIYESGEPEMVDLYSVTFSVDMTAETVGESGVFLSGDVINGWSPDATPMADAEEDGIYEVTVEIPAGIVEYKFVNSGVYEEFAEEGDCNITDPSGEFTNRLLLLEERDSILQTYIFNSCALTSDVEELTFDSELFSIMPNVSNDYVKLTWNTSDQKNISIVNANGQLVELVNTPKYETETIVNVSNYAAGIYFIKMDTPSSYSIKKLIVK